MLEIITTLREWWGGSPARMKTPDPSVQQAICWTCGVRHAIHARHLAEFNQFSLRHVGHALSLFPLAQPAFLDRLSTFRPNADIKVALQAIQTLTVTNLHSLVSSETAGWESAAIDNTVNLFLDDLVQVVLDPANTAPANSKAFFVYTYSTLDEAGVVYTTTGNGTPDGTEGTLTFPAITANPVQLPLVGIMPYVTADLVVNSRVMSCAAAYGGLLPPEFGYAIINFSGAALAASGNTVKHRGVYATSV